MLQCNAQKKHDFTFLQENYSKILPADPVATLDFLAFFFTLVAIFFQDHVLVVLRRACPICGSPIGR